MLQSHDKSLTPAEAGPSKVKLSTTAQLRCDCPCCEHACPVNCHGDGHLQGRVTFLKGVRSPQGPSRGYLNHLLKLSCDTRKHGEWFAKQPAPTPDRRVTCRSPSCRALCATPHASDAMQPPLLMDPSMRSASMASVPVSIQLPTDPGNGKVGGQWRQQQVTIRTSIRDAGPVFAMQACACQHSPPW